MEGEAKGDEKEEKDEDEKNKIGGRDNMKNGKLFVIYCFLRSFAFVLT